MRTNDGTNSAYQGYQTTVEEDGKLSEVIKSANNVENVIEMLCFLCLFHALI